MRRISEVAEHEARALLTTLSEHGIAEGTTLVVVADEADPSELALESDGRRFAIPHRLGRVGVGGARRRRRDDGLTVRNCSLSLT